MTETTARIAWKEIKKKVKTSRLQTVVQQVLSLPLIYFYRVCAASLFWFLALKSEGGAMQLRLKTDRQTDWLNWEQGTL